MDLYAIHRNDLCSPDELADVDARSQAELDRRSDSLRKVRSYVLDRGDGRVGTICLYLASDRGAIREHAEVARLPVDGITRIDGIDVQRPDPEQLLL